LQHFELSTLAYSKKISAREIAVYLSQRAYMISLNISTSRNLVQNKP